MGVIGGGGGGLYVIVLMFILKLSVSKAVGMALILSTITLLSAAWQYGRKKLVRLDYFLVISCSGIAGVLISSTMIRFISETALKIAIMIVFVFTGLCSLIRVKAKNEDLQNLPRAVSRLPVLIPTGLIGGIITGALGLSGAVPMTSFLIAALDFPPTLAVGTTLLIGLVINSFGALFHLVNQPVDLPILLIFSAGSIVGTWFGVKLAVRIDKKVLTLLLAFMTIGSGIYLALHG
jgi:uncharacterized membrane protein YfcA